MKVPVTPVLLFSLDEASPHYKSSFRLALYDDYPLKPIAVQIRLNRRNSY
jgi:hypothetical protein